MDDKALGARANASALPPLATPPRDDSVQATVEELTRARTPRFALRRETASALACSFAHEVRNPLSAVVSNLEFVLRTEALADESHTRLMESLRETLEAARQIENVVHTLALLVDGQRRRAQRVAVRLEILAAVRMAERHARFADTQVDLEFEAKCHATVAPGEVCQIVTNLLLNSLNALGSNTRGGRILVSTRVESHEVEISVDDDGPGWPSGDAEAPQSLGSGLGLIIVRAIVESRHGSVRLETSPRLGGARCVIRLPSW